MVSMRSLMAYFLRDTPRVWYFFACCLVILVLSYKCRDIQAVSFRNKVIFPSLVLICLFINPLSTHFLLKYMEETRVLRFFWLVPATLVMAFATVKLLEKLPKTSLRVAGSLGMLCVTLLFCRNLYYLRNTWKGLIGNWYKMPPVVLELCDDILADTSHEEKTAVFPFPLNMWVHQYTTEIDIPFAMYRSTYESDETIISLYDAMMNKGEDPIDLDEVAMYAKTGHYNYIVLPRTGNFIGNLEENGYMELETVGSDVQEADSDYEREYVLYSLTEELS
ncbi:MAG: hypothetical protein MR833_07160 [Gemmiger formicilis]|uniref:hypothetical protein n=1 Tax=Gemmiger formicilis TaxID=745368 RepID=UPI003FEF7172|nr:hypothetical protein [Gemmiger formicilis]